MRIASLRGGVELRRAFSRCLTTLLGSAKGALLLYDPVRLVYAPWAVRGYDQTTLHRMRIPLGANNAWNAMANGLPLFLSAPSLPSSSLFGPRVRFYRQACARAFHRGGKLIARPPADDRALPLR